MSDGIGVCCGAGCRAVIYNHEQEYFCARCGKRLCSRCSGERILCGSCRMLDLEKVVAELVACQQARNTAVYLQGSKLP